MAENTTISWTDHTWNWAQGCPKNPDSQYFGCLNCYMYRDKKRYGQDPVTVIQSKNDTFYFPLKSKNIKPGDKIFTLSWGDFFNVQADPWRPAAWDIIRRTPHYVYLILSKWPENILSRLPDDWGSGWPNVWLGVTTENQQMADKRIPILLQVPSAIRFVSIEPMLGPVNLRHIQTSEVEIDSLTGDHGVIRPLQGRSDKKLDWVIVGGESGNRARPTHPDLVRSIRDQCKESGTPFFFKQWGKWCPGEKGELYYKETITYTDGQPMVNCGTELSGNYLDGKKYMEFPKPCQL
jgi:protein gp37